MEQLSSLNDQVTVRFSIASLSLGLSASIWINAIFYTELTPIAKLACLYLAPLLFLFSLGYAIGGLFSKRNRAGAWQKITSGAEPIKTNVESGSLVADAIIATA